MSLAWNYSFRGVYNTVVSFSRIIINHRGSIAPRLLPQSCLGLELNCFVLDEPVQHDEPVKHMESVEQMEPVV